METANQDDSPSGIAEAQPEPLRPEGRISRIHTSELVRRVLPFRQFRFQLAACVFGDGAKPVADLLIPKLRLLPQGSDAKQAKSEPRKDNGDNKNDKESPHTRTLAAHYTAAFWP